VGLTLLGFVRSSAIVAVSAGFDRLPRYGCRFPRQTYLANGNKDQARRLTRSLIGGLKRSSRRHLFRLTRSRDALIPMDLEVMDVADPIPDHDGLAVWRYGDRHRCIFERCPGSAGTLLKIPAPERAVA
jgi:hypothetical protein